MSEIPIRIKLDFTQVESKPYKFVWFSVQRCCFKNVGELKENVCNKFRLSESEIDLYVKGALIREEDTVFLLRENDDVEIVYKHPTLAKNVSKGFTRKISEFRQSKDACTSETSDAQQIPAKRKRDFIQNNLEIEYDPFSKDTDNMNAVSSDEHKSHKKKKKHDERAKKFSELISELGTINYSAVLKTPTREQDYTTPAKVRNRQELSVAKNEEIKAYANQNEVRCKKHKRKRTDKKIESFELSTNYLHKLNDVKSAKKFKEYDDSDKTEIICRNFGSPQTPKNVNVGHQNKGNVTNTSSSNLGGTENTNSQKKKRKRKRKRRSRPAKNPNESFSLAQLFDSPVAKDAQLFNSPVTKEENSRKHIRFVSAASDSENFESSASILAQGEQNKQSSTIEAKSSPPEEFPVTSDKRLVIESSLCENVQPDLSESSQMIISEVYSSAEVISVAETESSETVPEPTPLPHISAITFQAVNDVMGKREEENLKAIEKDYSQYPSLYVLPSIGDHIAYKILELSELYCPEVSNYKEGMVMSIDSATDTLEIQLIQEEIRMSRRGKFENIYNEEEAPEREIIRSVAVRWSELIEPKRIS